MRQVTGEPREAAPTKLVAYYRVSTAEQGRSGLGLEAQEAAVERFATQCSGKIVARYREVESGKRSDRPELAKAIGHARRSGAKLVIAKLDRLARNVAFISALMENGVQFVCCDNPHITQVTVHILAAIAQEEARLISERTKAALAATKARGVRLGGQRKGFWTPERKAAWLAGLPAARQRSLAVRREKARKQVADLLPVIKELRDKGQALQAIANVLNGRGELTPRGGKWAAASVQRALKL